MAFHQHNNFAQQSTFASNFGHCESYFVENHDDDDGLYARAAAERERQRGVAKLKQKALAERLSNITADQYQHEILDHMERTEVDTMPDINSIEIQTEIQWFMRPYLLDFLLEAHHAFQLLPETLHLAVNILDRYCSRRVVYKRHYQLVGCAALLIAAKYGDRKERVPTIRELKSMCCSLYEDDMFTQMEWHVLQTLDWMMGHTTVTAFLQIALTEIGADPELEHMTWFIMEMALYHKDFIPVRPSVMARASLALARVILNRPSPGFAEWSSQYDPHVLISLSNHLHTPSQALVRKFASPQYSHVSTTLETFMARQAAMAATRVRTPTLELQAQQQQQQRMDVDMEQQHAAINHLLLTPQTPQKSMGAGYAAFSLPSDILTPPITPDKDFNPAAAAAGLPTAYHGHHHHHHHQPQLPNAAPVPAAAPSPPRQSTGMEQHRMSGVQQHQYVLPVLSHQPQEQYQPQQQQQLVYMQPPPQPQFYMNG